MGSELSVHYRHVELQSVATLRTNGDGELFLELAEPPPVRTVLELRAGAKRQAYEITAVVEVETAGAGHRDAFARGCRVREVDSALLKSRAVGSERLADAAAGTAPGATPSPAARARTDSGDDEQWSEEYGVQMAVPAPVVDPDGSDDSSESEIGSNGDDADDDGNNGSAADSDASRSAGSGKKRRGRRRK
jgi:hypothetical protein